MVLICNKKYEKEALDWSVITNNKFELSDFQKWAIWSIQNNNHVLVTSHTGAGKTLPAEFMILWFTKLSSVKKKVIYASPIKALSNQKLHDFRNKYPEISFGLLTGDIKDNPDADVLIMTTEILRNTLMNKKISENKVNKIPLAFELDFENDLGGIIFDEVHYINDPDRGSVWEQSILLLPPQVQMVLLSATLTNAEKFAEWVEVQKNKQSEELNLTKKEFILSSTDKRVVPLSHYLWCSTPSSLLDEQKNKNVSFLIENTNKPLLIKNKEEEFIVKNLVILNKIKDELYRKQMIIKRKFILNEISLYLKNNNMLPAICFIFSRKQVEVAAKEIEMNLHEENAVYTSTVANECKKILMDRLKNYEEFINLDEYKFLVKLLQKGIAIHHAGMIPVLREMVELLFERKFIKLLFATETFAVGINMPTKTVIFSSLYKFDGVTNRPLNPQEYTQMAGRAGRRGLDKEGFVIHLSNLFDLDNSVEYKKMICGKPAEIKSKFKISYNLILNVIASENTELHTIVDFVKQSMISNEIQNEINYYDGEINELTKNILKIKDKLKNSLVDAKTIEDYNLLEKNLKTGSQKQKKRIKREMSNLLENNKNLSIDLELLKQLKEKEIETQKNSFYKDNTIHYLENEINKICNVLVISKFIDLDINYKITDLGFTACFLQEIHAASFALVYQKYNYFNDLSTVDIIGLLSIYCQIKISDDEKLHKANSSNKLLNKIVEEIKEEIDKFNDLLVKEKVYYIEENEIQFDLMEICMNWSNCETVLECQQLLRNKEYFLGDFTKAILKINNAACELEKLAEATNNIVLLEKLQEIPNLTMKYMIDNQSLYV